MRVYPDLFAWAASRPSADVLVFNPNRWNPRRLGEAERAELEFRRALDLEPDCPIFKIEEGPQGSRWYKTQTHDGGVPWLTRGRRA